MKRRRSTNMYRWGKAPHTHSIVISSPLQLSQLPVTNPLRHQVGVPPSISYHSHLSEAFSPAKEGVPSSPSAPALSMDRTLNAKKSFQSSRRKPVPYASMDEMKLSKGWDMKSDDGGSKASINFPDDQSTNLKIDKTRILRHSRSLESAIWNQQKGYVSFSSTSTFDDETPNRASPDQNEIVQLPFQSHNEFSPPISASSSYFPAAHHTEEPQFFSMLTPPSSLPNILSSCNPGRQDQTTTKTFSDDLKSWERLGVDLQSEREGEIEDAMACRLLVENNQITTSGHRRFSSLIGTGSVSLKRLSNGHLEEEVKKIGRLSDHSVLKQLSNRPKDGWVDIESQIERETLSKDSDIRSGYWDYSIVSLDFPVSMKGAPPSATDFEHLPYVEIHATSQLA